MELRNLINVAYLVVKGASLRNENRGLHYNTDLETNHHTSASGKQS